MYLAEMFGIFYPILILSSLDCLKLLLLSLPLPLLPSMLAPSVINYDTHTVYYNIWGLRRIMFRTHRWNEIPTQFAKASVFTFSVRSSLFSSFRLVSLSPIINQRARFSNRPQMCTSHPQCTQVSRVGNSSRLSTIT